MGTRGRKEVISWVPVILLVLSFFGGIAVSTATGLIWFSKNVATVPYVDGKHEEGKKFTETEVASVREQAFAHSDTNRQAMEIEMKAFAGDIKGLQVQVNGQTETLRDLKQMTQTLIERRH